MTAIAENATTVDELDAAVSVCHACPRLVAWREDVAVAKRKSFAVQPYWGRPVPGWGSDRPRLLIVGLAPAAHGGNRTGRVFTGDRSGDWLYGALYRAGLASQPTSRSADDGLRLTGTYITAVVKCAPPDNAPTIAERDRCAPYFERELALLPGARVAVALGGYAYTALCRALGDAGVTVPRPRPAFGHGLEVPTERLTIVGCYHPSQQNTFTGRLTEPMLDAVFARARRLAGVGATRARGSRRPRTRSR